MSDEKDSTPRAALQSVKFHYVKSSAYRVVCAQGAIGSPTPQGKIFMSLYNERAAIPRSITHEVQPDGQMGDVVETDTRGGYVRELEVGIMLDREAAMALRDWLDGQVRHLERLITADAVRQGS